jgi:dienelactone hydrolase
MANDYLSGGIHIGTDVYKPVGPANNAAIVLVYGSDGLIDNKNGPWASMIQEDATSLAQKGFHALVPNYFLRTKTPAGSIDYQNGGLVAVMANKDQWQSTIADAVQYAKTLQGIDPSRIGLLGYSLGAFLSLRLCAEAKGIVAFFPPRLDVVGAGAAPRLPVDIHYGDKDFLEFKVHTEPIVQELRAHGAVVKTHCYPGANHGFSLKDAPNTSARAQSKTRMLDFFKASV